MFGGYSLCPCDREAKGGRLKTLLAVALTSHLLDGLSGVGARVWREIRPVIERGEDPVEWAGRMLSAEDAEAVRSRLERMDEFEAAVADLNSDGISAVSDFEDIYPRSWLEKLVGKHPPVLFYAGEASLLNAASIGIVGSRDVDMAGSEFAAAVAQEACRNGYAVVSGGARGVDQIAMRAAFECGGPSLAFLSDSLLRVVRSAEMRDILESSRVCLATSFAPSAGFSVGTAMARNKLIYAHSSATVVVSSALDSGGTWAGAVEAMSGSLCPVLVRTGDGVPNGNGALIRKGGIGLASPEGLLKAIEDSGPLQATLL